jgi:uncharacterized membrane protein
MMNDQMMEQAPSGMAAPAEIQTEIDKLSPEQKQEAREALREIQQIIQEMMAQGATEEEIEAFLAEMGISIEELEFAEKLFSEGDEGIGISI